MTDSRELRKAGPGGAGLLKKVQFSSPLGEAGAWDCGRRLRMPAWKSQRQQAYCQLEGT